MTVKEFNQAAENDFVEAVVGTLKAFGWDCDWFVDRVKEWTDNYLDVGFYDMDIHNAVSEPDENKVIVNATEAMGGVCIYIKNSNGGKQ